MTYNPFSALYRTFPAIIDPDNTENSLASQIPKTVLFDILERLKALEGNQGTGTTPGTGGAATWGSITGDLQNQTDLSNKLATKADAATVTSELANKADKSTVTVELDKKADTATIITDLATKADAATVTTELDKKADKTTVDAALAKKADTINVNSALTAKADSMMVTTELAKKADKTVVDRMLNDYGGYADKSYVNMFVNMKVDPLTVGKADKTTVTASLATKADKTYVDTALATKADAATVTTELAKKADKTTVNDVLATKADTTTVNASLDTISNRVKELEDHPTGGGATWGSISGDLQNQTDLNAAIAKKADTDTVNASLATKADAATVTTELTKKADTDTVHTALATKADAATVTTELAKKADNFTIDSNTLTMSDTRELSVKNVGGTNVNYSVITETYDLNTKPASGTQFLIVNPVKTMLVLNPPVRLEATCNITIQNSNVEYPAVPGSGFVNQTVTVSSQAGVDTYMRRASYSPDNLTWDPWVKATVKAGDVHPQPDYIPLTSAEGSLFTQSDFITDTQDPDYTETFQIQSGYIKFNEPETLYRLDPNDPQAKTDYGILNAYEFIMDLNVTTTGDPTTKSHDYVFKIPFSSELVANRSISGFLSDYTSHVNMLGVSSGNTISISIEHTYDEATSVTTHYLALTSHGGITPNDVSHLTQLNFKLFHSQTW